MSEPPLEFADLQVVALALAELALRRPGWDVMCERIARQLGMEAHFAALKRTSADVVGPGPNVPAPPPPRNYLEPGNTANGRPARMARYFAQTIETPGAVAIVATFGVTGDWRAYIGSADGHFAYPEAAEQVAAWGVKLDETDARWFFPDITLPYASD